MGTLRNLAAVALRRVVSVVGAGMSQHARVPRVALLVGLIFAIHPRAYGQIHYVQSANSVSSTSATAMSASFYEQHHCRQRNRRSRNGVGPAISSVVDTQEQYCMRWQWPSGTGNAICYATNIKMGRTRHGKFRVQQLIRSDLHS